MDNLRKLILLIKISLIFIIYGCYNMVEEKDYTKQEINKMLRLKGKKHTIKLLFNSIKKKKYTTDIWYSTNVFDTISFAKRNLMISLCSNDMKKMFWIWCIKNDIKLQKETEGLLLYKNEIVSDYYNPNPEKINIQFIRKSNNDIDVLYEFYKKNININGKLLPENYEWKIIQGFPGTHQSSP